MEKYMPDKKRVFTLCHTLVFLLTFNVLASESVTVFVNSMGPGAEIADDALGLSYETSAILPDAKGDYYFHPDNKSLVTLFKTLGIRCLRIGGNSVDAPVIPLPEEKDVGIFFEFAKKIGVKVIYSIRLQEGDPQYAARIARLIRGCHEGTLQYFSIGNEPAYYKDYNVYSEKWCAIRDAILGEFPGALFCGPDQNPSPELCRKMIRDFGTDSGRLAMITQHSYPFGCSYINPGEKDVSELIPRDAADSRENMLSPNVWNIYEEIREKISGGIEGYNIPYRLTEVNSYWFSGLKGASNRHASALWGIDYMHWWISHGAHGLNFHTGDTTGGAITLPCQYAVFVSSAGGYEVRPLGYAMKLFDFGGHGQYLPVNVSSSPERGLVAYATLENKNSVAVTLINKAHGKGAVNTDVQIRLDAQPGISEARVIFLTAPGGDIAAESGLTLGGASIQEDGSWYGQWTSLSVAGRDSSVITVSMPPASAAVVKMLVQFPNE